MVSATPVVTFYFDYLSPFAYLAETQVHRLDATIDYRPIQTLDVMERVGNTPSFICKAKRRYQGRDAGRWAQRYGVRLARHPDYARIDGRRLLLVLLHRGFDCLGVSGIERGQVSVGHLDGDAPGRIGLA